MKHLVLLVTGIIAFGAAGCLESKPNVTSATQDAVITYQGKSAGTNSAEAFNCDGDDVVLQFSFHMKKGEVNVEIKDGLGSMVYANAYADGNGVDNRDLTGAQGDWRMTITRSGGDEGFDGSVSGRITCR